VEKSLAELEAVSPHSIMERGYGAIIDEGGRLVTTSNALKKGDFLTVIFKDGKIRCLVEKVEEASYGR
jgi:exonuclease VII large subunit